MKEQLPGITTAYYSDGSVYYRASITYNRKHISLGGFASPEEGSKAYLEASAILNGDRTDVEAYDPSMALPFHKYVSLTNLRNNGIYIKTPIYLYSNYFLYHLTPELSLKFDRDDLFFYSSHTIQQKGGYLFICHYGSQYGILSRYGIHPFAVADKDYIFVNGDNTDYRYENPDPVPLLYQTGYLTIWDYDERRQRYTLGFPNEEVKYGFLKSLLPDYTPAATPGRGTDIFALDDCLEDGDTEGVREILTALFASIPYTTDDAPFEHYFQSVLYIVFTLLGQYVQCEVHSSRGRADCILETERFVYIFEFKVDVSAEAAIAQIEEKGYALPYGADPRKLYKIGVSFDSKERSLAQWMVG